MPYHDKYILQIARRMISFHSAQDMKLLQWFEEEVAFNRNPHKLETPTKRMISEWKYVIVRTRLRNEYL